MRDEIARGAAAYHEGCRYSDNASRGWRIGWMREQARAAK